MTRRPRANPAHVEAMHPVTVMRDWLAATGFTHDADLGAWVKPVHGHYPIAVPDDTLILIAERAARTVPLAQPHALAVTGQRAVAMLQAGETRGSPRVH